MKKTCSRKLLQTYPQFLNYILKYATSGVIVKQKARNLRHAQPTNMTPHQLADNLVSKSRKIGEVHDKGTLNDVFVDGDDASIRNSQYSYWSTNPLSDWTEITFWAESLLCIQKWTKHAAETTILVNNLVKTYE